MAAFNNYISAVIELQLNYSGLWRSRSLLLGLLQDEGLVDVRDHTTTGNRSFDQSVKLLVTSNSEQQVSWCDSLDLQVLRGIACELQDLSSEVFEDGGTVHG